MKLSFWLNIVIQVLGFVVAHLHDAGSPAADKARTLLASAHDLKQDVEK